MPRSPRVVAAVVATLLTVLGGPAIVAATVPPTDPPVVTANEFIPDDRDLSECVSAIPKPGCGSEARGGWRQGLVLGVVVAALAFVGWRITVSVRRGRRQLERTGGR